jgi:hypothetical protein
MVKCAFKGAHFWELVARFREDSILKDPNRGGRPCPLVSRKELLMSLDHPDSCRIQLSASDH